LDSNDFLERPEGAAFWTMMLLSFAFLTYSYAIAQIVDWFLVFVLIMAGLIFRVAWVVFAWCRPLSVARAVEKAERASFWMTSMLSFCTFGFRIFNCRFIRLLSILHFHR
jgi:hypothetical protein